LVTEKLSWPNSVTAKILPEIYQFWLSKRERLQKPLLRRFWPQISSSDTNPHHVFRARDKERYRLRKQQKKNDIESFRRMRQMRQEFQKARDLLLLVLEREKLKEVRDLKSRKLTLFFNCELKAELDVRMRIFEHNLRLVDGETAIHYPRSANGDSIESKVVAESDQGQDISKSSSGQASIGDELIAQGPSLETAPSNYPTIPYVLEDAVKEILKRKSQAELIAEAAAAAEKANKEVC
jgi:enhancer of polycomb-like protein